MWASIVHILANLTPLSYSLIVLAILAITLVALKGHIKARFGKKEVELGPDSDDSRQDPILRPPKTVTIFQKRSCGDCILLLMGEREKCEIQMRKESNKILKDQMNFAEQKLIEIQNSFMGRVIDTVDNFTKNNSNAIDKSIQYKLVYGLFKDALVFIKDNFRRSFKDNGFYDSNETDFREYSKNQVDTITSMIHQYIRNIFPDKTGIINLTELGNIVHQENSFLTMAINDIYIHAREIKIEADNKIDQLQQEFSHWIDEFIKN